MEIDEIKKFREFEEKVENLEAHAKFCLPISVVMILVGGYLTFGAGIGFRMYLGVAILFSGIIYPIATACKLLACILRLNVEKFKIKENLNGLPKYTKPEDR